MASGGFRLRGARGVDLGALLIAPLGVAAIAGAQALAGVPVRALFHLEAALVVFGGTLGATLLSCSIGDVARAARAALRTFRRVPDDRDSLAATIVHLAGRAYRNGLVAVEAELGALGEPFLRDGLIVALDEPAIGTVHDVLTMERTTRAADEEAPARLLETAAGYAPTFGILGAVLGLIHVMQSLSTPRGLGGGVAVAFVATVYGVGAANLLLLPLAGRIREHAALAGRRRELMVHGICAIHQRLHPRVVAHKLRANGARSRPNPRMPAAARRVDLEAAAV